MTQNPTNVDECDSVLSFFAWSTIVSAITSEHQNDLPVFDESIALETADGDFEFLVN